MLEIQNQQSCIIPTRPVKSQSRVIIHTGLVTAGQVADMLHTNVPETTGQLTPLCQAKQHVHHPKEGMLNTSVFHMQCQQ